MPINYLNIHPQITEYCRRAVDDFRHRPQKIESALRWLHQFADEITEGFHPDLSMLASDRKENRCARPAHERVDQVFSVGEQGQYCLLASDGSQIISSHHDVLPISLINTATIFYQPGSSTAPQVNTLTEFFRGQDDQISIGIVQESVINTARDVRETQVLTNFAYDKDIPLITLSDGPLELFQEPRSGGEHRALFSVYQQVLHSLCEQGRIMAGYTDKPRANLVLRMLELAYKDQAELDLKGITDADIFSELLTAGQRSAVFELNSPSSAAYPPPINLHFFYLNVGDQAHPWIVRVEIMAHSARNKPVVSLLQQALLDQCRLMGSRPYPYVLHRAHEEAVVHFHERDTIVDMLTRSLREQGVEISGKSHKQDAKDLGQRTRLD